MVQSLSSSRRYVVVTVKLPSSRPHVVVCTITVDSLLCLCRTITIALSLPFHLRYGIVAVQSPSSSCHHVVIVVKLPSSSRRVVVVTVQILSSMPHVAVYVITVKSLLRRCRTVTVASASRHYHTITVVESPLSYNHRRRDHTLPFVSSLSSQRCVVARQSPYSRRQIVTPA